MHWRALEGFEKALGAKHASTVSAARSLALLYKFQGKIDEAAMIDRLASQEAALSSVSAGMNEARFQGGSSASDAGSIFSEGSESRTSLTNLSEGSEQLPRSALDQLVALFLNEDAFVPVEASSARGERFARNFRRLLRQFARDLIHEVQDASQRAGARFVRSRINDVTHSIRVTFDPF